MKLLDNLTVSTIVEAGHMDLVAFGDEGLGVVILQEGQKGPWIFDFSSSCLTKCCDDFLDPLENFLVVGNYGSNYLFSGHGRCKFASHASEVANGALVLKGQNIYFSFKEKVSSPHSRFFDLTNCKSVHADHLGGVGYFEKWRILVIRDKKIDNNYLSFEF